jgi:hypothetical protein
MSRDLTKIKKRLYRVMYRDPATVYIPPDEAGLEIFLQEFTEIGYCRDKTIKSAISSSDSVTVDTGKKISVAFTGKLEFLLLQSEISDYNSYEAIEGIEKDVLIYSEVSKMCVLYPSAVLNFNETVSSGETESIAAEYEMEDFTLKSQFRIRFNVNSLDEFFTKRESLIISTSQMGMPAALFQNRQSPQVVRYVGTYDRTYIVFNANIDAPGSSYTTNYILYYDNITGEASSLVDVGPTRTPGNDSHGSAAMEITDDGHIVIIYDELNDTGAGHNDNFRIMRSTNPEDINNIAFVDKLEDSLGVDSFGCYPILQKRSNGDLFVFVRHGQSSSDHYRNARAKSTDGGLTWSYLKDVLSLGAGAPEWWAGPFRGHSGETQDMYFFCDSQAHGGVGHTVGYLMRSSDGDTFYNIDKTFSKNIETLGAITKAELDANYIIEAHPGTVLEMYNREVAISPDETMCFLMSQYKMDTSPIIYKWYLFYFESSAWVKKEILNVFDDDENSGSRLMGLIAYNNTTVEFIVRQKGASIDELQRWRTTDKGTSWAKIEDITLNSANGYGLGCTTFDYNDQDFLALVASERTTSYSDIFLQIYTKLL